MFALDLGTDTETVLHSFGSQGDGGLPYAGLLKINGKLYGTTFSGGATACGQYDECGTVFVVDIETGSEDLLYSFCSKKNCIDGSNPYGGLIDVNGTLYGTTVAGGTKFDGTVFSISSLSLIALGDSASAPHVGPNQIQSAFSSCPVRQFFPEIGAGSVGIRRSLIGPFQARGQIFAVCLPALRGAVEEHVRRERSRRTGALFMSLFCVADPGNTVQIRVRP